METTYTVGVDVLGDPRRNDLFRLFVLLSEAKIKAPSGRELPTKEGEGERVTIKLRK